ncbi:DUF4226 domain-containing protein [Mycolicibacterium brumae]|uniref:DUF4226 domain-containing protein n=1 Tax=Mycolicibacterium brumae TaxID=85968 RepID=A0A2G5PDF4_9MYCO|nr:DUF4226 domain-containing protein [Mycolicibacterium brumae]MCV7191752.1 DUF4226 domain-containing protein [Mycolicibacterium brumae]PIB76359.1 DUF4226 domain-containing protein [Mycolicibacterium brumae]RWA15873.1 hypothetical protein MBRU_10000 [Mycolicibacterium brumae DSM 44177]UWW07058.1 DUF4226 domain-containing protein [Mycolicibacterium brumae]
MAGQRGRTALNRAEEALRRDYESALAADHDLSSTLSDASRIAADARRRLNELGAQIRSLATPQTARTAETPAGAADLRRQLAATLREMEAVVADTAAQSRAKATELQSLSDRYRVLAERSTG